MKKSLCFSLLSVLPVQLLIMLALPALAQEIPVDPMRYEDTIAEFEAADKISPPPVGAIVLTGSSSIARWNHLAQAALAPLTVIPRGFGGTVMEDILYYIDRVALAYKPRAILVYAGDNDTGKNFIPEDKIVGQFQQIVDRVHAVAPATRVYVLSVKPSIARWGVWSTAQRVSAGYKKIADHDPLVHYVDVATPFIKADGSVMDDVFVEDGLHLNDKGNAIWGTAIKAALLKVEGQFE